MRKKKVPPDQQEEFDEAIADAKAEFEAQLAKTKRLKALRLARDATKPEAEAKKASKPKPQVRRSRTPR